jgi:hypothetical protein
MVSPPATPTGPAPSDGAERAIPRPGAVGRYGTNDHMGTLGQTAQYPSSSQASPPEAAALTARTAGL